MCRDPRPGTSLDLDEAVRGAAALGLADGVKLDTATVTVPTVYTADS